VINEQRLQLADPAARKFLAAEMERFFFGGELSPTGYVPPSKAGH
jgi:Fe-S cluster biosynthesis and repair protein YggX